MDTGLNRIPIPCHKIIDRLAIHFCEPNLHRNELSEAYLFPSVKYFSTRIVILSGQSLFFFSQIAVRQVVLHFLVLSQLNEHRGDTG